MTKTNAPKENSRIVKPRSNVRLKRSKVALNMRNAIVELTNNIQPLLLACERAQHIPYDVRDLDAYQNLDGLLNEGYELRGLNIQLRNLLKHYESFANEIFIECEDELSKLSDTEYDEL